MKQILLINPANPNITMSKFGRSVGMTKYRVWSPLSLFTLANITPPDWTVEVIDENLGPVDYDKVRAPDIVGLTAFTSQATRAYQLADYFRKRKVPTVMGGIHASFCKDEAMKYVDSVFTGEAEGIWQELLEDVQYNQMRDLYEGGLVPAEEISSARHDLLAGDYFVGSIQTTRGCPLRCNFCSVTAFNGGQFRHRPVGSIIEELHQVREKLLFFVDDNIGGTKLAHAEQAKELFRAMAKHTDCKPWMSQTTINFADDDELIRLARQAGCAAIFIGFESITEGGLKEVHKKFNMLGDRTEDNKFNRDMVKSVQRIQKHGIAVTGNFIIGLDSDEPGIGKRIAQTAHEYGLDVANVLINTPLPGTELYKKAQHENRLVATNFPTDWQYFTLFHPISSYKNFTWSEISKELNDFVRTHQTLKKIMRRTWVQWKRTKDYFRSLMVLVANLSLYRNYLIDRRGW